MESALQNPRLAVFREAAAKPAGEAAGACHRGPAPPPTEEEYRVAAEALEAGVPEAKERRRYLRLFHQRRYPGRLETLLTLAEAGERSALSALAHFSDPRVREYALRQREAELLPANFEPGDHARALEWYSEEPDPDRQHWMESDLMDLWDRHPQPESEPGMLLAIYERSACCLCRERAVKRLLKIGALPREVHAECAFEASEDIRQAVRLSATILQ